MKCMTVAKRNALITVLEQIRYDNKETVFRFRTPDLDTVLNWVALNFPTEMKATLERYAKLEVK